MLLCIAQTPPLPCYGTEQSETNFACANCEHKPGCRELMGSRYGLVPITQAKFDLKPEQLPETTYSNKDEFRFTYVDCYKIIFGAKARPDNPLQRPDLRHKVIAAATELRTSPKLFMLAVMFGHYQANPQAPFFCTMLSGQAAINRVSRYKAEILQRYGSFTEDSLDKYGDIEDASAEASLLASEIQAGSWIVGYKIKHSGKVDKLLFKALEFNLSALWLASEPTYHKFLIDCAPAESDALRRHRSEAIKMAISVRRSPKKAVWLFKLRSQLMPEAIKRVLALRNLMPEQLRVDSNFTWPSTLTLWSRVGLAIQHYYCLEYLYGNSKVAERQLTHGSLTTEQRHV